MASLRWVVTESWSMREAACRKWNTYGINTTYDISKLLYVGVRQVKFETILKYHKWYLLPSITYKSCYYHPRRPSGSQSGREKGRGESFQVRAKEPQGTDSHRAISKIQAGAGS